MPILGVGTDCSDRCRVCQADRDSPSSDCQGTPRCGTGAAQTGSHAAVAFLQGQMKGQALRARLPICRNSERAASARGEGGETAFNSWGQMPKVRASYRTQRNSGKAPNAILAARAAAKVIPHSMVSSARAINQGGIARWSAFAALRLITNSHFCGDTTGSSSGLAPLRMRPA